MADVVSRFAPSATRIPSACGRGSAVRRRLAGGARGAARARPAQRRPPHARRLRGGGGRPVPRLARARACSCATTSPPSGSWGRTTSGPDGSRAAREGIVASLRVEPYETRRRAAARANARRPEGEPPAAASRGARPAGADLPPLRRRAAARAARPAARPGGRGDALWRVAGRRDVPAFFAGRQLLIADGHHRYETSLAYARERDARGRAGCWPCSSRPPIRGWRSWPTHRVFAGRPDIAPPASSARGRGGARAAGARSRTTARRRSSIAAAARGSSRASRASSTSSSSTAPASRGSRTRSTGARRSPGGLAARPTVPSSSGRRGSRTCSSGRAGAR